MPRKLGVAVVGMGWMGHVHARAYKGVPVRWSELDLAPELVVCADDNEKLASKGASDCGFARYVTDWREAVTAEDVDVVSVCLPNKFHAEVCIAAAAAGKHIWCEKPVGRNSAETAQAARAAAKAGIASMAGYNYRWAPMVQYAANLLHAGELGELEFCRCRFFSMYGHDPMGLHSWRFTKEFAGLGSASDLLSHATDMAITMAGPIKKVCGMQHTYIKQRPLAQPGQSHYAQGKPGDPTAEVENEDLASALCEFESGLPGVIESCRTVCGPKAEMSFEIFCRNGSARWNLERMNELELYRHGEKMPAGYAVLQPDHIHPDHARFNPGAGIGIGYEDTKIIESAKLLEMIASGKTEPSGLARASMVADTVDAVMRSTSSGKWEQVGKSA